MFIIRFMAQNGAVKEILPTRIRQHKKLDMWPCVGRYITSIYAKVNEDYGRIAIGEVDRTFCCQA